MPQQNITNKRKLAESLSRLASCKPHQLASTLASCYHSASKWRGSHPLNEMQGTTAIEQHVWSPLLKAFPDLERRDLIVLGGRYQGRDYVASLGHYCGTFQHDWLTIPASGQPVFLRYGEVHQLHDGKIIASTCLWDLLDLMRQANVWPIAPSLGSEGMWSGPITGDGLVFYPTDSETSAASLTQTLMMHKSLADYDDNKQLGRAGLLKMPQKQFWHPKMMWYGPAGIGTTRGLAGFVDYHQLPFRVAFPNRQGGDQITDSSIGGHYIQVGDGHFSVTGGWPSVIANHTGANFLGLGPTGKAISMRVMDFYLHHEGLIRENWVPIDIIDFLRQIGVDVFQRLRDLTPPRTNQPPQQSD